MKTCKKANVKQEINKSKPNHIFNFACKEVIQKMKKLSQPEIKKKKKEREKAGASFFAAADDAFFVLPPLKRTPKAN